MYSLLNLFYNLSRGEKRHTSMLSQIEEGKQTYFYMRIIEKYNAVD